MALLPGYYTRNLRSPHNCVPDSNISSTHVCQEDGFASIMIFIHIRHSLLMVSAEKTKLPVFKSLFMENKVQSRGWCVCLEHCWYVRRSKISLWQFQCNLKAVNPANSAIWWYDVTLERFIEGSMSWVWGSPQFGRGRGLQFGSWRLVKNVMQNHGIKILKNKYLVLSTSWISWS